jgi:hypothetical protein
LDRGWKFNAAFSATDGVFVKVDATAVAVDDEPSDGKTEARSATRDVLIASAGEEAIEDTKVFARGDSWAAVVNSHTMKNVFVSFNASINNAKS